MNALQALIAAHCEATGETYADIARRGDMSRQTVSTLATREVLRQTPRAVTLAGLAKGLEVDINVVRAAAARAAGFLTIEGDDDTLVIIAAMGELDDEQREALKRRAMQLLAEAKADQRRARRRRNNPARGLSSSAPGA